VQEAGRKLGRTFSEYGFLKERAGMAPAKEAGFSPSASLGIKKPALHGTALTTTDFAQWRDWRQVCVVISRRGHDISCPYAKKEKKDAALAGKNHRDANTRKGRRYEGKSKMAPLKRPASESRPYMERRLQLPILPSGAIGGKYVW